MNLRKDKVAVKRQTEGGMMIQPGATVARIYEGG